MSVTILKYNCYRLLCFFVIYFVHRNGGEEGMTQKEYEQSLEIEKLKKEITQLRNKNKDLESEKKTLKEKLKIQSDLVSDLMKENKTIYYKNKYELEKIENKKLQDKLGQREQYITQLSSQLKKNSSNSSKPSSTDGFKKVIHNSREKTDNGQGAQEGHEYHAPKLISKPDKIVKIKKPRKCTCGGKIIYDKKVIKRQLIDILNKYYTIEYQGQIGKCEKCGKEYFPQFPKGINNSVQYGQGVKGMALILSEYGNVPVDKIQNIIGILTNSNGPVGGSIMNWKNNIYEKMIPIREDIKEEMLKSPIINNDETPYNLNGKQKYAIGAFTETLSAIECNGGREKEAFDKMNIFPRYSGIIMGDHYAVNESFQGQSAFCNIHPIRDARGVLDIRKDSNASEYIKCILSIKEEVEQSSKNKLSKKRYKEVRKEYKKVLENWKQDFQNFMKGKDTKYYNDERKLINLLLEYVDEHLLFAKIDYVMFTNNLAERGLRPVKSKMKVIGGFRNQTYSDGYCCSLSIIQTAQKQGLNPCEVFGKIIDGERKVFEFQRNIAC